MQERLQKILSAQGICSRRKAEEYIKQGRVKVNGLTAGLGDCADPVEDVITFDGREVGERVKRFYVMLNKPRGYVTTLSDEAGRPDVASLVTGVEERVYPVGRLDMDSEGLLLLTNDGQLAQKLTHPSHQVYKQYQAHITYSGDKPPLSPEIALSRPMVLDGRRLAPAKCELIRKEGNSYWLTIEIREGRNRQIRRMCALNGYTVNNLRRVAVGDVKLNDLTPGKWRHLSKGEVRYLKSL